MFRTRIEQLKEKMRKERLDAVLISSVANVTYLTGYANFSKDEREAYLLIGEDFQYLITDGRYAEAIKTQIPHFILWERSQQSEIDDLLKILNKDIKNLGIEEDDLTVREYKKLRKYFQKLKHTDIRSHRAIKIREEVSRIEKAVRLGDQAFAYIIKKIKTGISEKNLAQRLEFFIKKSGGDLSFPPIVAFGANSAIPHHQTGSTKLKNGDFVLLDFGVKIDSYCSDMTRTMIFGKPTVKQTKMYEVVLQAQRKAVDFINRSIKEKKEIKAAKADKVARQYIRDQGFPDIPHSLGHGIGLEVHEHPYLSPKSKEILKNGMVFSIEPGIYLPNFGSPRSTRVEAGGVRIEDLFVLEKGGLRQITNSPKEQIYLI